MLKFIKLAWDLKLFRFLCFIRFCVFYEFLIKHSFSDRLIYLGLKVGLNYNNKMNALIKILISFLLLALIANIVVSLVLGHTDYYNPHIKANYSGFIASVIGIFALIMFIASFKYGYSHRTYIAFAIVILVVSPVAIGIEGALGFYFGLWACIVWILISFMIILWAVKFKQIDEIDKQQIAPRKQELIQRQPVNNSDNIIQSNDLVQGPDYAPKTSQKRCTKQKCGFCCHACCSITTILFMNLFTWVAVAYYANLAQYPVYGTLIQVYDDKSNSNINVHGYCQGTGHATRPTIFLEHGGGSNSMAFVPLANILSAKNWKVCSYDRLGYGRSSSIIVSSTIEKRAEITSKVIAKLTENDTNKNIIMGGWSAGVELSQIYRKIYPTNVQGMIFIDGYPDYITLTAIKQGKQLVLRPNIAGATGILKVLEPLSLGFIVGSNPIENTTLSNYYRGYYQTGYFWESQYYDVTNPYTTTDWLTTAAGSDQRPYPDSKINLNWPDINIPLLVMPANQTVSQTQSGSMYLLQCQKYIAKCTSANKQLTTMKGDHAYTLKYPQDVADQIHNFFSPLF